MEYEPWRVLLHIQLLFSWGRGGGGGTHYSAEDVLFPTCSHASLCTQHVTDATSNGINFMPLLLLYHF